MCVISKGHTCRAGSQTSQARFAPLNRIVIWLRDRDAVFYSSLFISSILGKWIRGYSCVPLCSLMGAYCNITQGDVLYAQTGTNRDMRPSWIMHRFLARHEAQTKTIKHATRCKGAYSLRHTFGWRKKIFWVGGTMGVKNLPKTVPAVWVASEQTQRGTPRPVALRTPTNILISAPTGSYNFLQGR